MKDNKGKKKPEIPGNENAVADADGQEVTYTPEQRRLLRDGLRIWARVAIRSYMREQAEQAQASENGGEESD